jgi:outer membrane protein OmpA-like peptidoglycan-associated protein
MTRHRLVGSIAAVGVIAALLSGCDNNQGFTYQNLSSPCPVDGRQPLTLIVGARANSPQPTIPADVQTLIHDAAISNKPIEVIRLDGQPSTVTTATFATNGQNPQIRQTDLQNFEQRLDTIIGGLQPKAPQADVLAALSVAGQSTRAGGTIVLMDSGVPTVGPLSYQDQNMFGANPSDVTAFLSAQHLLPQLAGKSVVLVNVGYTADPQPALPQNLRTQVIGLWTAVAKAAKATCVIDPSTPQPPRTAVNTAVPVAVVPLPAPPTFSDCGTTVLSDSGSVGFVVGTANFRDPNAAQATLQTLATMLEGHTQRVKLTGSTSSEGDPGTNQVLSEHRAVAVKGVLVHLGIADSRITAVGVGSNGPNHVPDMTSGGVLIPAAAEQNRAVTVTLTCQ